MKASRKVKAAVGLTAALVMGISTQAFAAQDAVEVSVYQVPMHFVFDGKEYAPPEGQQGFIYEGSTYVPLRFISYSLGKAVKWDGDSYTVSVSEPKDADKVTIDEYKMNSRVENSNIAKIDKSSLVPSTLQAYKENVSFIFDGAEKKIGGDLPSYIIDGSLYVPMRFFSESVGKTINWDPDTYSVSANTAASTDPKQPEVKPVTPPATPAAPAAPAAPTTPAVGGGSAGGGGGAGAPSTSNPSYDSITSAAEAKLQQLKEEDRVAFTALYQDYLDHANDPAAKAAIKQQVISKLAESDSKFAQIISDTQSKLESNQYDTSVIDSYKQAYQDESDPIRSVVH
ncbi:copper amine oxidase N-terminal domain-containing protein [Paenibacillus aestuarii]|uniref:Copper amine oxidase N-terminal domain-containing protein n=1 Tax=Paenibacillus aestuarii TaxID=516965 RepID=A0ABW0K0T7_9BACL|nr:copper amine oxidase N-terminal domain-containing protein [Paenibacillus aestuarii]